MMRVLAKDKQSDKLALFNVLRAYVNTDKEGEPRLFMEVLCTDSVQISNGSSINQITTKTITIPYDNSRLDSLFKDGKVDASYTYFEYVTDADPNVLPSMDFF